MTLQQLRYFIETANTLHYTRAAENLNISQPSLSYAISQLSKTLGVPLFKKDGIKVYLTEYGEAFLPYAESAINILSQGRLQIDKMLNPSNENINLGYIYTVSFDAIPHLIEDFYSYLGNRKISFNFQVNMTNTLIEQLLKGHLDVVMAPNTDLKNELVQSIQVFEQELFLIVYNDHHLAKNNTVVAKDLINEKFIMIKKDTDLYYQTITFFKKHNFVPNVFFEVDECNSMASFVGAQLGIAIMPKIPSLDSYKVVAIPFKNKKLNRTISIHWNRGVKSSPALKSFLDYCISTKAANFNKL